MQRGFAVQEEPGGVARGEALGVLPVAVPTDPGAEQQEAVGGRDDVAGRCDADPPLFLPVWAHPAPGAPPSMGADVGTDARTFGVVVLVREAVVGSELGPRRVQPPPGTPVGGARLPLTLAHNKAGDLGGTNHVLANPTGGPLTWRVVRPGVPGEPDARPALPERPRSLTTGIPPGYAKQRAIRMPAT